MPELALSTSWQSSRAADAAALTAAVANCGAEAVELDCRIPAKWYPQLVRELRSARIAVTSLHNFCPHPAPMVRHRPGGDLFLLSSTDRELRREAVDWTVRTLENAHETEARVVVLHCGRVDLEPATAAELARLYRSGDIESPAAQNFTERLHAERARRLDPHLDAVRFSLDRLVRSADRLGVVLGLENRYHFHELPGPDEMALLLREFGGAPMGYWHDTGHAHAQQCLGLGPDPPWLDRFGPQVVGAHLHDAIGLDDHLPPGKGELDWPAILARLPEGIPRVMELAPGTDTAQAADGLKHLTRLLAATRSADGDQRGGGSGARTP